jgi:hypothetical protein
MKAVLQPLNEKAKDIIVKHADLLQSSQMEPLLLQLVAHVSAYRVILQRCGPDALPHSIMADLWEGALSEIFCAAAFCLYKCTSNSHPTCEIWKGQ